MKDGGMLMKKELLLDAVSVLSEKAENTPEHTVFVKLMIFSSHLKFSDMNMVLPPSVVVGAWSLSLL